MKILLINDRLYPDFIGGVEKRNYDLAIALAERGHEVTLTGFGCGASGPNVTVRSLGALGRLYSPAGRRSTIQAFRYAWRVLRLDLSSFDVVETSNIPHIHVIPLALRCAFARKPLVVTWYEFWGPYWKTYVRRWTVPFYRLGEWVTAQLGTEVIATSRLTAERLAKRRLRKSPVRVVACGIDSESVTAVTRDVDRRRSGRGEGSEKEPRQEPPACLVYAGRLIREKRVDLLLSAFARLTTPSVRLVIFGEGPELGTLVEQARSLGVAERVEFRGHVEDAAVVWRAIRESRAAVQPSSREGFGIFPLEAMALGVPVVYCESPDSAVPELVRDGIDGICCRAAADDLARAVDRVLGDDSLRELLARNAAARAREYDRREIAATVEMIAHRLVSQVPATSREPAGDFAAILDRE